MAQTISQYIKSNYNLDINNPISYLSAICDCENQLRDLRKQFFKEYTYCCGCRGYAKVNEAYEDILDNGRVTLKCGKCNSIWKFLD